MLSKLYLEPRERTLHIFLPKIETRRSIYWQSAVRSAKGRDGNGVAERLDSRRQSLPTCLGVLVSAPDENNDIEVPLLLDDGTGVVKLILSSADFRLCTWKAGMYVMVIGGYSAGAVEPPVIKVHKIVDLSAIPDREAMWYLEVMEAYKLFYGLLIEEHV
ncbi:hypothetical protein FH972_010203 [Carpinus fangiana]|uniref:Uncharacterized protein n=1 Tax=Carpinus fangiana TaxID=176857 RepID=A0A660KTP0_9ROSI|nr:hypothetical protein FH972_010203 [Carpinus fangiana]